MKKTHINPLLKKGLGFIFLLFIAYNSVYFKKLSEVNNKKNATFDFVGYADSLYYKAILKSNKAVELNILLALQKTNPDSAFKAFGNRLGIGNSAFFMVKSAGKITKIEDGKITVFDDKNSIVSIDSKYIFGNAIRDASGLVKLTDFKTNADFNKVSEALNTIIREKFLPPIVQKLKIGNKINFVGALKLSKKEALSLEVLPVSIELN